MTGRLRDEHILVTGGCRGIGAAIAAKALAEAATVSIIDIEDGNMLVSTLDAGRRVFFERGDVRSPSDIARFHRNETLHRSTPIIRSKATFRTLLQSLR